MILICAYKLRLVFSDVEEDKTIFVFEFHVLKKFVEQVSVLEQILLSEEMFHPAPKKFAGLTIAQLSVMTLKRMLRVLKDISSNVMDGRYYFISSTCECICINCHTSLSSQTCYANKAAVSFSVSFSFFVARLQCTCRIS